LATKGEKTEGLMEVLAKLKVERADQEMERSN
jgi:hypothetical protein